jgi:hypothetical protein
LLSLNGQVFAIVSTDDGLALKRFERVIKVFNRDRDETSVQGVRVFEYELFQTIVLTRTDKAVVVSLA